MLLGNLHLDLPSNNPFCIAAKLEVDHCTLILLISYIFGEQIGFSSQGKHAIEQIETP